VKCKSIQFHLTGKFCLQTDVIRLFFKGYCPTSGRVCCFHCLFGLLGYNSVYCCGRLPSFRRTLLSPSSGRRHWEDGGSKVTTQKTSTWIFTAVKISNLAMHSCSINFTTTVMRLGSVWNNFKTDDMRMQISGQWFNFRPTRNVNEPTPCGRILVEKLTATQRVKIFLASYGTRRFITAFSRALHWPLSIVRCIQSKPSHPISLLDFHFNIIFSHIRLRVAANMWNKKSRRSEEGWPSNLRMGIR